MKNQSLFIIFAITLTSALGLASVTPALPKIASSLSVSENQIGLIFTFFAAPSLILTPLLGFLADIIGRKKVLIPSLFLFSFAGFGCFFAPDFNTLLILRFIEGIGASALGAINVTLIGDLFKDNQRTKIMGLNNSVLGICTALFPILGGLLSKISWNYIFLLPLLALPVGILSIFYLDNNFEKIEISIKTYFLNIFKQLIDIKVLGLLGISSVGFIVLFGAYLTYTPFILVKKFGLESFQIGLIISSMSIFMALFSSLLGRISKKYNYKQILFVSIIFYAIALSIIPQIENVFLMLIPTMLFGFAHGLTIPTIQSNLAEKFAFNQRATFMSINRMVAQIGQAVGPFIMGFVLFNSNINYVFYFASAIVILTVVLYYLFFFKRSL
jgi:MFS family permease